MVRALGFPWLMVTVGALNVAYAPLCWLLRCPPAAEESTVSHGCSPAIRNKSARGSAFPVGLDAALKKGQKTYSNKSLEGPSLRS